MALCQQEHDASMLQDSAGMTLVKAGLAEYLYSKPYN